MKTDLRAVFKRRPKSDIHVAVQGGDVTLTGTAHSWLDHDSTSSAAWGTSGVQRVVNKLAVAY